MFYKGNWLVRLLLLLNSNVRFALIYNPYYISNENRFCFIFLCMSGKCECPDWDRNHVARIYFRYTWVIITQLPKFYIFYHGWLYWSNLIVYRYLRFNSYFARCNNLHWEGLHNQERKHNKPSSRCYNWNHFVSNDRWKQYLVIEWYKRNYFGDQWWE